MKSILVIGSVFLLHGICFSQEGALKNVIIKYDTTYERNNMHKGTDIGDFYVDKGLVVHVFDGPYSVAVIEEKRNNLDSGIFLSFYIPSNMPKEKGHYYNGYEDGEFFIGMKRAF